MHISKGVDDFDSALSRGESVACNKGFFLCFFLQGSHGKGKKGLHVYFFSFRTKGFLESSGCRTRPLKTSGYQPRRTQMGENKNAR